MDKIFERLRQRKIVQWALAYTAASFALIQVLDIIAQRFSWPEQAERFIIVALSVGFFVALVLAWYHGERGAQRVTGTELLILALLLSIGGAVVWRLAPTSAEQSAATSTQNTRAVAASAPVTDKSIAVLPFENLSDEKANAYFASGMQDEILTRLAGIGALKVISRTSTEKYKSHPDNLKTVAAELGVATVLEGSVQKSGDTVRVNVQLIDARADKHLWANTYDRELKNVFAVESEVSQDIAEALKATLTPSEASALAAPPTKSVAAYDLFLKAEYEANEASDDQLETSSLRAEGDYRRALALDPDFALAHANLAYSMMMRHWFVKRLTSAELADVKTNIDRAIALAPELPEAHLALGYFHYWGYRDYEPAILEFRHVLELAPSNAQALAAIAFIHRRKGEWPEALAALDKALSIAPRDTTLIGSYGETYMVMRRNAEAEPILARGLAIDPANVNSMSALSLSRLFGYGDAEGARKAFDRLPSERKVLPNGVDGDVLNIVDPRLYPDVFERHFSEALRIWDSAPNATPEEKLDRLSAQITIKTLANEQQDIQPECTQLNNLLEADGVRHSDDPNIQSRLSWTKVCLGLKAEAIQAARRAADMLPLEKDAYFGAYYVVGLAQIDAHADQPDEALQLITQLLSIPAGEVMTITRLDLDPVWDPLRGDPRFQKLIADGKAALREHDKR